MTACISGNIRFYCLCFTAMAAAAFSVAAQTGAPHSAEAADSLQVRHNYTVFCERLSALVTQTVENNRSLKAASIRVTEADAAVEATIGQAPPRFEVAAMDARTSSFPNPLRDQMRMEYSIEQMLMFPGKLSAMRRGLQKQQEMATYDRGARVRDLVYKVKSAFYELYLIDRQCAINRASQAVISDIVKIAHVRYGAGTGTMPDILRAQTETAALTLKMAELEQKRLYVTTMINALRAVPLETGIDGIPEIRPPPAPLSLDTFSTVALEKKSELQAMRANIEMKKVELAALKLEWYPDFAIRTTYSDIRPLPVTGPMSPEFGSAAPGNPDRWTIMLGVTIPEVPWVLKKNRAQRLRAQAALNGANEELAEMVNMTAGAVHQAFTAVKSSAHRMQITSSSVLPQAQLAFESTLSSYTTGGADFTMLLDVQRMLLTTRESYQMQVMEYLTSLAALEYASGVSFDNTSVSPTTSGSTQNGDGGKQ